MHCIIVENTIVNFVGKYHQIVFFRQANYLLKIVFAVHRTGRIVRVNNYDTAGISGDLTFNIGNIGLPVIIFVALIVHRRATGHGHRSSPQWVVRGGYQYLIVIVKQRLHCHHNQLADTVAHNHIIDDNIRYALGLSPLHNGFAR